MSEPVIDLEYVYSSSDEAKLDAALSAMQADIGGQRRPWHGARAGAIDLATFLEFVIIFIANATLGEVLKNYFAGLAGAEKAKKLGERHNDIIVKWLDDVRKDIRRIIISIKRRFQEGLRAPYFENMEKPIALRIGLGQIACYIVLNGRYVSDDALERLPEAVTGMLQFIYNIGLPEETTDLQLCPDPKSCEWRYLLAPSYKGFGRFVDRIIDLSTGQILYIHSRQEFIKLLGATKADGKKFLVDPFRYPDKA